jgi:hopanoid biosynthesis associated RND transporter like protein HpnN
MSFLRRRYLNALADAVCGSPRLILLAGIVLTLAGALVAVWKLEFKTGRNDLIGSDTEYWHHYSAYAREFGGDVDYIIVVESDDPVRNRAAVDAFVAALLAPGNNPHPSDPAEAQQFTSEDLFYRVNFDALMNWFLYYLSVEELDQIRATAGDFKQLVSIMEANPRLATFIDAMNQMLQQMNAAPESQRRQMAAFLPTVTAIIEQLKNWRADASPDAWLSPWAGAFFSEEMIGEAQQEMKWQGYQVFQQGKMLLVLVHPRVPEGTNPEAFHSATVPKLKRIIRDVAESHRDVRLNLTGEPVLDYDEMQSSQRDAIRATLITLALIAVIFIVGFHEWLRPVLGVVCMMMVVAVAMGWATLAVGHLNLITITFAVMLLGLGIDLGIQLNARFEEELARGAQRQQAVHQAMTHTGASIITAGLTNAAAFFAMTLSGFKGVMELGIIAGGGLLIATLMTMTVLPAMLLLVKRSGESSHIPAQAVATRFERVLLRYPLPMLGAFGAVTVASLLIGWQVQFDYNVLNLQSKGLPSVETELRLLNADAESTIYACVVCDTLEETRRVHHSLTGLPSVATVHSITELIPEQQAAKAVIIREIQAQLGRPPFTLPVAAEGDAEALSRSLAVMRLRATQVAKEAVERHDTGLATAAGALTNAIHGARERLKTMSLSDLSGYEERFFRDLGSQLDMITAQVTDRTMNEHDVPVELRRMLIGKSGKHLVRVFPKENIWEREPLERFVREVSSVAPHATGTPLGLYEFVAILQTGYIKAALWAFLVITIIIAVDFRGFTATVLTLLPLLAGVTWMVGVMALFGITFNPANIMTLPLIVGIGVAYGIYVVQRYRQEGDAMFYGKSTGRAVLLSALTTIAAFACLILGLHRGIRSLGLVMTIGVAACLLAGMAMLPALLETARRRGWKV